MAMLRHELAAGMMVKIHSLASFREIVVDSDEELDGPTCKALNDCSLSSTSSTVAPSEATETPRSLRSLDFGESPSSSAAASRRASLDFPCDDAATELVWEKLLEAPDERLVGARLRAKPPRKFAPYEGVVTEVVDGRLRVRFEERSRAGELLLPGGHAVELQRPRAGGAAAAAASRALEERRAATQGELLVRIQQLFAEGPHPLSADLEARLSELRAQLSQPERTGLCGAEAALAFEGAETEGRRRHDAARGQSLSDDAVASWACAAGPVESAAAVDGISEFVRPRQRRGSAPALLVSSAHDASSREECVPDPLEHRRLKRRRAKASRNGDCLSLKDFMSMAKIDPLTAGGNNNITNMAKSGNSVPDQAE